MEKHLQFQLTELLGVPIQKAIKLAGGDISRAYQLHTKSGRLFCKIHHGPMASKMFYAEKVGLECISNSNTIKTPEVISCESLDNEACLILEFIASKRPSGKELEKLGHQLADLHQLGSENFGFPVDNFIGSLPQSNRPTGDWAQFYARERLLPQFKLARDHKFLADKEIPGYERILEVINTFFSNIEPALLHGDLWAGNYLISLEGEPYLIDPAVYYGHREVDLAMTRLFSGFGPEFYAAYNEVFPNSEGQLERQELYQLYYLLVHLNLFGLTYYQAVADIVKRYF